jgi:hypothetical protein
MNIHEVKLSVEHELIHSQSRHFEFLAVSSAQVCRLLNLIKYIL